MMRPFRDNLVIFLILFLLSAAVHAQETVIPIPNGGFENGFTDWTVPGGETISSVSNEQAASGTYSLKIADASSTDGSSVTSTRISITESGMYELRGQVYMVLGSGLGMYINIYDASQVRINSDTNHKGSFIGPDARWRPFSLGFYAPEAAAYIELWVHSYSNAIVEGYLDDLEFIKVPEGTPWTPEYKIDPQQTSLLTDADVVGPDGIVYPNWTECGARDNILMPLLLASLSI